MFQRQLADYLSKALNVSVDSVQAALDGLVLCGSHPSTAPPAAQSDPEPRSRTDSVSSVSSVVSSNGEVHPCEYVPRGKTDPCGKNARRFLALDDGTQKWYCGTEKSGHMKSASSALSKPSKPTPKKKTDPRIEQHIQEVKERMENPEEISTTTNKGRRTVADIKSRALMNAITRKENINVKGKTLANGEKIYMEVNERIAFRKDSREAYGHVTEDDVLVETLEDKHIRWLETHDIPFVKTTEIVDEVPEAEEAEPSEDEIELDSSEDEIELED